jgi:hypothetical protein
VAVAVRHWDLADVAEIATSRSSWLLSAQAGAGRVVLKAPFEDPANYFAAQAQLAEAGVGPAVIGTCDRVLLVEEVSALSLAELPVVGLAQLRAAGAALHQFTEVQLQLFPPLCAWLRERLGTGRSDVAPGTAGPTVAERHLAWDTLEELAPRARRTCHGDLRLGHVLVETGTGRAVLVGARGCLGDPAWDVAVLALEAAGGRLDEARGLASETALVVGVDPHRAVHWLAVAVATRA